MKSALLESFPSPACCLLSLLAAALNTHSAVTQLDASWRREDCMKLGCQVDSGERVRRERAPYLDPAVPCIALEATALWTRLSRDGGNRVLAKPTP